MTPLKAPNRYFAPDPTKLLGGPGHKRRLANIRKKNFSNIDLLSTIISNVSVNIHVNRSKEFDLL